MSRNVTRWLEIWRRNWKEVLPTLTLLAAVLTPVMIYSFSRELQLSIQRNKDLDVLLESSNRLECGYRAMKNHFESYKASLPHYDPTEFWERLDRLDYSMINFYFKIMLLDTPQDAWYAKAQEYCSLLDNLYWGKGDIGFDRSFRRYLEVSEQLARTNREAFVSLSGEPDQALQYFDNLMHLVILTASLSKHSQAVLVETRFRQVKDDIRYLEGVVNHIPGGPKGYVSARLDILRSAQKPTR